ncbi:hypothetical protein, partial [Mesorhizobium sp. M1A.F.Ca.ET.072.01.1.1]|uniref:hypothetical protein n=1 Tax=Mesorhizobium sp. M1A.F.Ca.ET.072.01.1.1 TaxID=2496753 RepID=UPI001AECD77F
SETLQIFDTANAQYRQPLEWDGMRFLRGVNKILSKGLVGKSLVRPIDTKSRAKSRFVYDFSTFQPTPVALTTTSATCPMITGVGNL